MLLGEDIAHVHIHDLVHNPDFRKDLQKLETKLSVPLSYRNPDFELLNTTWIHEPGVHIGICGEEIIFMVRIT
jgi:hypothetical protein